MYDSHGGIALAQEEGVQIAQALGKDNIACILQNHGYLCAAIYLLGVAGTD